MSKARKLTFFLLAFGAFALVLLTVALRMAMTADASPLLDLQPPPSALTPVAAPPAPPATSVAEPVPVASEVPRLDALHQYAVDAVLTLTPPYAERTLESQEHRRARWTHFALECADAVAASDLPTVDHPKWALSLLWIAHRESLIAEVPRRIGTEDDGLAQGPWQIHAEGWLKELDVSRASTALTLLRKAAAAWSLPQGKPWLGLAADRGKHGVNRPSVMEYLAKHPFPETP